eukprot:scaffold209469_cov26-Tisochrysis_lutea.AAC.4
MAHSAIRFGKRVGVSTKPRRSCAVQEGRARTCDYAEFSALLPLRPQLIAVPNFDFFLESITGSDVGCDGTSASWMGAKEASVSILKPPARSNFGPSSSASAPKAP